MAAPAALVPTAQEKEATEKDNYVCLLELVVDLCATQFRLLLQQLWQAGYGAVWAAGDAVLTIADGFSSTPGGIQSLNTDDVTQFDASLLAGLLRYHKLKCYKQANVPHITDIINVRNDLAHILSCRVNSHDFKAYEARIRTALIALKPAAETKVQVDSKVDGVLNAPRKTHLMQAYRKLVISWCNIITEVLKAAAAAEAGMKQVELKTAAAAEDVKQTVTKLADDVKRSVNPWSSVNMLAKLLARVDRNRKLSISTGRSFADSRSPERFTGRASWLDRIKSVLTPAAEAKTAPAAVAPAAAAPAPAAGAGKSKSKAQANDKANAAKANGEAKAAPAAAPTPAPAVGTLQTQQLPRLLLIEGDPGVGKSSIVARLFHTASKLGSAKTPNAPSTVMHDVDLIASRMCAIHFCMHNDLKSQSPRVFVDNILAQLMERWPALREGLLYSAELSLLSDGTSATFSWSSVTRLLADLKVASGETHFIAIDSLDEANCSGTGIVELLNAGVEKFPPWLRFVVTSRPLQAGSELKCRHMTTLNPKLNPKEEDEDVRAFVRKEIAVFDSKQLTNAAPSTQAEFEFAKAAEAVIAYAGHNFLVASQVLSALKDGSLKVSEIDRKSHESLDAHYAHFLRRQLQQQKELAWIRDIKPLLELIVCSQSISLGDLYISAHFVDGLHDPCAAVDAARDALRHFITETKGIVRVYHRSFSDWLQESRRISTRIGCRRLALTAAFELRGFVVPVDDEIRKLGFHTPPLAQSLRLMCTDTSRVTRANAVPSDGANIGERFLLTYILHSDIDLSAALCLLPRNLDVGAYLYDPAEFLEPVISRVCFHADDHHIFDAGDNNEALWLLVKTALFKIHPESKDYFLDLIPLVLAHGEEHHMWDDETDLDPLFSMCPALENVPELKPYHDRVLKLRAERNAEAVQPAPAATAAAAANHNQSTEFPV